MTETTDILTFAMTHPTIVCAWCQKVLATVVMRGPRPLVSHGICADCERRLSPDNAVVATLNNALQLAEGVKVSDSDPRREIERLVIIIAAIRDRVSRALEQIEAHD